MMYEQMVQHSVRSFLYKVYAWMFGGLAITAGIAYYIGTNEQLLLAIRPYFFPLILLQLGMVLGLSFMINKLSYAAAALIFMLYAISVGITTSVIFMLYAAASIYVTFGVAAGMFGVMAVYGYVTRTDLTSMGSMLLMCLIGLILGGIINIFLRSEAMQFVLSGIGVVVFTLLTAYDSQKIKELGAALAGDVQMQGRAAILGALTLYLDFINLFLYLLQFTGRRKE